MLAGLAEGGRPLGSEGEAASAVLVGLAEEGRPSGSSVGAASSVLVSFAEGPALGLVSSGMQQARRDR